MIIGNNKVIKELNNSIDSGNILHSYMFYGPEGIGKKEVAKKFAKRILCFNKKNDCECKSCISFDSSNHPDYTIVNEEGETIKIDTIRQMIQSVYEKPILSEKKIYIINDAEKMTKEAQNSLLKTLEEPPEYIIIILIVANLDLILNTIKSRCTKVVFDRLTTNEIKEILKTKNINCNANDKIFDLFDGSVGKAINVIEKKDMYDKVDSFIQTIETQDKIDFLTKNKEIFTKEVALEILDYVIVSLFYIGKENRNVHYINSVNYVQKTINRIKQNCNFDMSIDYMLLKIWEEIRENYSWS